MFSNRFARTIPVETETTEPDAMFEAWIHYLRNSSSDDAYDTYMRELGQTHIYQAVRPAI